MNVAAKTKKHWPGHNNACLIFVFFLALPFAVVAGKKGVVIGDASVNRIHALNVSSHQNWKLLPSEDTSSDCLVLILWGIRGQLEQFPKLFIDGKLPRNLLVYNEPELDTQANRSVQEVVCEWRVVTSYSTRISALNVAKINSKWLTHIMGEANHLSLKVDFLGIHWYGSANPRQFLALIDKFYG